MALKGFKLLAAAGAVMASVTAASAEDYDVNPLANGIVKDGLTTVHSTEIIAQKDYFKANEDFARGVFDRAIASDASDFSRVLGQTVSTLKDGYEPDGNFWGVDNAAMKDVLSVAADEIKKVLVGPGTSEEKDAAIDTYAAQIQELGELTMVN